MNKTKLKTYAPQARRDFITTVTARANQLGLSEQDGKLEAASVEKSGDVVIIAGQPWPAKVQGQREQLIKRIQKDGFAQTMEAVAYTWFNRFAALRYMEIHDYLDHGHRVLSNRAGGMPEILNHATELELPGYNKAKAVELKLAGSKDGELYKILLVAQCNALSRAMPFLFERIDDETELLLPDNLLRTDSIIARLVEAIPEEDWQEVEIIGWLYQFYISEKKDQVIGKVVKSEDIPAATQLFTPNWIVQYLVQNSVGRLWLMANPASTLKSQWPYYIQPAEQTAEVQAQLDALIQTRINEDGGSLNPETITMLDPACGSGHILVVAYDVLKAIYLERGYQLRAIPRLILEKNLYGLDIDDRAAQMAGFALLMKARADDRRLLNNPPKLNVLSLQESKGLSVDELSTHLAPFKVQRATITALVDTFEHSKTFGSLIQIPYALKTHLALLPEILTMVQKEGDMYANAAAADLLPLVQQAQMLAMQFDAVVANPPYMGNNYLNPSLKKFQREKYTGFDRDLFSSFTNRCLSLANPSAQVGLMTPFVWMFLSSHEVLRKSLISNSTITSLVQPELHAFFDSAFVSICFFTVSATHIPNYLSSFVSLTDFYGADLQPIKTLEAISNQNCGWLYRIKPERFSLIPGYPLAYTLPEKVLELFPKNPSLGEKIALREGIHTGNNERYLRYWHEVDRSLITLNSKSEVDLDSRRLKWVPYNKGGAFRKWYGNNELVIAFDAASRNSMAELTGHVRPSQSLYFKPGGTWSALSSGNFGVRYYPEGFLFDSKGQVAVGEDYRYAVAMMNSGLSMFMAKLIMPTMDFKCGDVKKLPYLEANRESIVENASLLEGLSKEDWDYFERSWDFQSSPIVSKEYRKITLVESFLFWNDSLNARRKNFKNLEEANNQLFLESYKLEELLAPDLPENQITLARADREKDCQRLISYAIGCMMGRYSLDEPGLIYAHAGNVGFEPGRYATFTADADGIVPITDELWFEDDAPSRIREFLRAVWGDEAVVSAQCPVSSEKLTTNHSPLATNMQWLAESLGTKASETPDETIRRYLSGSFFKDHLQTYKKRPIYWLFSSGKQGAFQALVYLHRYHEGTLARMRSEYVVPLTGKIQSRIEMLTKDAEAATVTSARNKINKEIETLRKKHVELLAYDEKLRHYADMRIKLDLDDGVKVNYGKFGDLLSEVKAVTGGGSDD